MRIADKMNKFYMFNGQDGYQLAYEYDNKGQKSGSTKPLRINELDPDKYDELFEILLTPYGFLIKSGEYVLTTKGHEV